MFPAPYPVRGKLFAGMTGALTGARGMTGALGSDGGSRDCSGLFGVTGMVVFPEE